MVSEVSRWRSAFLALAFLLCIPAVAVAQGVVLYGATGVAGEASALYQIDPETGQATLIGPIGFSGVTGLAFLPDGRLVGSANTGGEPGNSILIEIDRTTGAGTLIGVMGNYDLDQCARMPDLTYDFSRGRLLAYADYCPGEGQGQGAPEGVHVVDPATGLATSIGPSGYSGGGNGLAWNPSTDTLYGTPTDNGSLVVFDPGSGAGSDVPDTAGNVPNRVNALAFHPVTGVLYGSWNIGEGWSLVTISLTDGAATTVGPSVNRLDALAFHQEQAPPATVTVVASPGLGGSVAGGGVYAIGQVATVSASPAPGWVFVHWLVNDTLITSNPYSFEVSGDVTLTAVFQLRQDQPIPLTGTPGLVLLIVALAGTGVLFLRRMA